MNPLALLKAISFDRKAEEAAFRQEWDEARSFAAQAIAAYQRVGARNLVPIKIATLSAMIDYRVGRYDAVATTVRSVLQADGRLWRGLKAPDATYLRFYLAELMEHVAGADAADNAVSHLELADAIGTPRSSLELPRVDRYLLGLFPLAPDPTVKS